MGKAQRSREFANGMNWIRLLIKGFFLSGILLPAAISVLGQDSKAMESTIIPCRWEIAAKAANFRMSFGYALEVSENGTVSKVTEVSSSQRGLKLKFVRDEVFVECMKKWHLEPAGNYFVSFYVGTTSIGTTTEPRNYLQIVYPNKNKVKIEIFLADSDTLIVEKPKKTL